MANPVTPRHVRHRKRSRLRRSRNFRDFLTGLESILTATGAAIASWTATAPVTAVASTGVLTASAIANGDTITIGAKVYTFQDTLTDVDGNVKRSGTLATDLANLVKAINLTGVAGTDYATSSVIDANVSAVSDATTMTVTAKTAGTAGDAIASTETSATAAWGAATLAGGVDAVAATANLAKTTHGLAADEGPFLVSNSGGSLPTPLDNATLYYVASVPDANTFTLTTEKGGSAITLSAAGSGTNTMTKASSLDAIFEYLKKFGAPFMRAATDVDDL